MTFRILPITSIPILRSSIVQLQEHEMIEPKVRLLLESHRSTIESKLTPKYEHIIPLYDSTFTVNYLQTSDKDLFSGEYKSNNGKWN